MKRDARTLIAIFVALITLVGSLLAGELGQRYIVVIRQQRSGSN